MRQRSSSTIPDRSARTICDDPFFDPEVQSRMAGVIADNADKNNEHIAALSCDRPVGR